LAGARNAAKRQRWFTPHSAEQNKNTDWVLWPTVRMGCVELPRLGTDDRTHPPTICLSDFRSESSMANPPPEHDITLLLATCQNGDGSSLRALMAAVYDQLRAMAYAQLEQERAGHTLQPTALVHEAFIKLLGPGHDPTRPGPAFAGRAHLFAAAATAMRRILVDHARSRGRLKRAGPDQPHRRIPLSEVADSSQLSDDDMLALDEALRELAGQDPRAAHIVELRFMVGLSLEEIANVLDVNERTIRRQWLFARAYLLRALGGSETAPSLPPQGPA